MDQHLVVLVHGLWGNPEHMWYVKKALRDRYEDARILVSDTNVGNRTYDGIDVCGERIAKEVQEYVAKASDHGTIEGKEEEEAKEAKGATAAATAGITRISFVGYSLGGLAARYAIGVLNTSGFFDKVEPITYTTFATPHCGVASTSSGIFAWLVSSVGPKTLSVTGSHIFLADGLVKTRPLLEVMSDPASTFHAGLARFKSRTCYANIIHDRSVPYYTAAIVAEDPFADLKKVKLTYQAEYGNTILDTKEPYIVMDNADFVAPSLSTKEIAFRTVILAGLPLWLTAYSVNAVVANYASSKRIALHRAASPSGEEKSLAAMTQDAVEEVMDTQESEPHALKLSGTQTKIVKNLNTLEWTKYMVHIQKTQHSHAAIVCRTPDTDRLSEGEHVMRHWLDEAFLIS